MMKVKTLRVHQAVKVGNSEAAFLKEEQYDMELYDNGVIKIRCKRSKAISYTSLHNVPWFTAEEKLPKEEKIIEKKPSTANSTRSRKPKK